MHPRQHVARRRRLEVDRRGTHLEERRPSGHGADLGRRRPPEEPRRRLGRGARPHVGAEPGAGDLPDDGRRRDVEEGPLRRREDRRERPRDRPDEPADPLRRLLAGGPEAVDARERRAGLGLWKSTDGGDTWKKLSGGLPEGIVGRIGVSVSASRPDRVYAMVEAEKGGLFRTDDAGEKWTRVNDGQRPPPAGLVLLPRLRRPEERRHRLRPERPVREVDRRRQDLHRRPDAARRQPRPLDRPGRSRAHDRRQRRRRERHLQRRAELVHRPEPADGAVLPRRDRQPRSRTGSTAPSRTTRRSQSRAGRAASASA